MNDEIKEILESLDKIAKAEYYPEDLLTYKECQLLLDYITKLQKENDILNDITESYEETSKEQHEEIEKLQQRIDKAIAVINTQMKNLSKDEARNLRIIKFNLIKGSCTPLDLTTEEDYKY